MILVMAHSSCDGAQDKFMSAVIVHAVTDVDASLSVWCSELCVLNTFAGMKKSSADISIRTPIAVS
jgi:hypothetical protein